LETPRPVLLCSFFYSFDSVSILAFKYFWPHFDLTVVLSAFRKLSLMTWVTIKFVTKFDCNNGFLIVIKLAIECKNNKMLCPGGGMNFSGRSHSLGDISCADETTLTGAGGSLRHIAPAKLPSTMPVVVGDHASSAAGETSSLAELEDTDIFSHRSPLGEDFHPDNSVLDSDEGEDINVGGSGKNEMVVNMDTGPNTSTGTITGNNTAHEHHLDAVYYQCRSARTSKLTSDLISISRDSTFGQKVTSSAPCIGSFEDHSGIDKTFHGSRFQRGPLTVNQSISASFDPAENLSVSAVTPSIR
jgi:hypothetical protein